MDAGYTVAFDEHGGFHGNTSPAENTAKHAAMKGFLAEFQDYSGGTQQVYFRVHIATNVLDRMARYHSYEVFMRDSSGAVSHWQGWFNSGDPANDRFVYDSKNDPGRRPIVLVQDETTFPVVKNEHWYMRSTASWNWDFAWTVDATTYYFPTEAENTDMSTWKPTGRLGTVRRFEPAWYGPDSKVAASRTWGIPKGSTFYATQFGEIVSGPGSARCSSTTTMYGTTYQNQCLPQFIATTARAVEHLIPGGNPRERVFPGIGLGVTLPN
jgi:dipeptidyl aminopeptidase/acylaminoacyl peptidase